MIDYFHPKVSIVIPVYNGSNFLRESIKSALAQTYKNIEIIVVNDGSTDNGETERIALSYGDKIRYFSKENGGTSTALNCAISHMTGEYFSWLSHDDMYYPKKIARQVEELEKLSDKNTIMMSDLDGINEKRELIYKTNYIQHIKKYPPREYSYLHPVIYNQTHGCTLLIPRKCFEEVGLFDEKQRVAQDFEFFYRAFQKFPHKLIPEILVTARESSNRQGQRKRQLCIEEYSSLFIQIIENLSDEEIKLLAPDKISFYLDMKDFFSSVGYTIALDYINNKIIKNLQISSYDLVGNKFNGHDLHFSLREAGIDSKQLVLFKESNDVNTYTFDFESKDATKNLLQHKLLLDADIVHLHLIHNIFDINYLPLLSRLKPTLITLHDPFFLAGHCVHHFDCVKWQTHCMDCPYLNELFRIDHDYSALNFEIKKQAIENSQISAIVASKWMENKVRQSPIWKGKNIYCLPFGVNQEIFKPADIKKTRKELNLPDNAKIFMFRNATGSFKGMDVIKHTLSQLENPENIVVITVGEKGGFEEYADKYKILEYGWIYDDAKLAKLYQACDIFLMPSRQETFGMMAAEAMACGKMTLVLEGEGTALPEIVDSPNCGLAVSEEDFASELQMLINDPVEIEKRGQKSFEYAKVHYSKDKYIQRLVQIYKEVITSHYQDRDAELVLQQLKKYANGPYLIFNDTAHSPLEAPSETQSVKPKLFLKVKSYFVRIFRKLPIGLQRIIEPFIYRVYMMLFPDRLFANTKSFMIKCLGIFPVPVQRRIKSNIRRIYNKAIGLR
ncbi:MAG TPA: glycosyltransferase [Anaerovoracaceae bacterium]|nr:glycosyltransferase [Anaerovoracaceae bacterium]